MAFMYWLVLPPSASDDSGSLSVENQQADQENDESSFDKSKTLRREQLQKQHAATSERRGHPILENTEEQPLQPGGVFVYQLEAEAGGERVVGRLNIAILKKRPRGLAARVTLVSRGKRIHNTQDLVADPTAADISLQDLPLSGEPFGKLTGSMGLLQQLTSTKGRAIWSGKAPDIAIKPKRNEKSFGGISGTEVLYREGKTRTQGRMVRNPELIFPVIYASEMSGDRRYSVSLIKSDQLKAE